MLMIEIKILGQPGLAEPGELICRQSRLWAVAVLQKENLYRDVRCRIML